MNTFDKHNGYAKTFQEGKLSLGLFFPLEAYEGSTPQMNLEEQVALAQQAEKANFASLFVRDIPLDDPSFGDVGQMYDPWIFLTFIAAQTKSIALGTGSVITTLRHPLDVAKLAASFDLISNQRLLFGAATGDRPIEFDAYQVNRTERSELFRESIDVMKQMWQDSPAHIHSARVQLDGTNMVPKPALRDIPVLITGRAGQSLEWIAEHGDGWIQFPYPPSVQAETIKNWRSLMTEFKPFSQSLYIDLAADPNEGPTPIHLGFRSGTNYLIDHLFNLQSIGVNHVILNVKFATRPIEDILQELGEHVIPHFPALSSCNT